jgi:trans-aconitate methyltransferase
MAHNNWNPSLYQQKHAFVFEYGKELLALLAPQLGETILDIGCGTGQLTKAIADTGARVIGIDKSREMIDAAQQNFPEIEFLVADASDFSFAQPFDAVFSNAALHWVRKAAEAAECIAKALRTDGRLVVEFGGKGNCANISRAIQAVLKERLQLDADDGWYFPSIGEYASLLERNRLMVTGAWLFDRPTILEGEAGLRNWIEMFCKPMFASVPADRYEATMAEIEAQARRTNYRDGIWYADYRRLRMMAWKD